LNAKAFVHVVKNIVYDRHIRRVRIDPVIEMIQRLAVRAAYVVENVAVECKVRFRIVKVNAILADLVGLSMVGDVLDFVPADRDIVALSLLWMPSWQPR